MSWAPSRPNVTCRKANKCQLSGWHISNFVFSWFLIRFSSPLWYMYLSTVCAVVMSAGNCMTRSLSGSVKANDENSNHPRRLINSLSRRLRDENLKIFHFPPERILKKFLIWTFYERVGKLRWGWRGERERGWEMFAFQSARACSN